MIFSKKKRESRKAARRYKKEVKAYNTYISLNKARKSRVRYSKDNVLDKLYKSIDDIRRKTGFVK